MVSEALRGLAACFCAIVVSVAVVHRSAADESKVVVWPFDGCEADDVRSLAGTREGSWQGDNHLIGPLTLQHRARLGMDVAHDRASLPGSAIVPAPLALTLRGGHEGHHMRFAGSAARSLADGMGDAAFLDRGERHRVLLDHGVLGGSVWLRIRTVVSCSLDADQCSISSDPVVYVPYDDTLKCGALASEVVRAF